MAIILIYLLNTTKNDIVCILLKYRSFRFRRDFFAVKFSPRNLDAMRSRWFFLTSSADRRRSKTNFSNVLHEASRFDRLPPQICSPLHDAQLCEGHLLFDDVGGRLFLG
jgi:hypothetical protein